MAQLGVNVDHVATLRQARRGQAPSPADAALICEKAGCHSIVAHLREDRRHIQDRDIWEIKQRIKGRLNLEMSVAEDVVKLACQVKPFQATLVPERRQELTTEGGLQVAKDPGRVIEVQHERDRKGLKELGHRLKHVEGEF